MLTKEENEMLTSVGKGTPCGELLRRYWMPIAAAGELTEAKPIKTARILGEDLVVYRDKTGHYGVVGESCPHRKASLAFGRVDEEGIRCPYHGWKFDCTGKCIEQPAEPESGGFKDRIKHVAYPAERLGGLIWTYMGPLPAPLLPRFDVLTWEHGRRWVEKHELYNCNWLQPMENSVDPSHLFWLHGETAHLVGVVGKYEEEHNFIPFEFGIIKQRRTPGRKPGEGMQLDQHPLVFPITLRHVFRALKTTGFLMQNMQIRVPVDDAHTQVFVVYFTPNDTDRSPADGDTPWEYFPIRNEKGEYRLEHVLVQDAMAWETQGAPTDRSQEHLGVGDEGIILLRKLLREQIEIVKRGGEPLGIVRDPSKNKLIEFDVINERVGLFGKAQKVA
ncbi:MAG: Rieske 2Fe-2S domain-containing protein [Deltaproteobacteria bacterium]|nr:Rieske 2Fe-2S domain-containing protein [Deltaproteobacteria bacterium]MBM4299082.1 Rieske 2Fe-2S domain-containing protein [Deltaproteobacteria bacterium]